jgi:signal transduction histidine kinase
LFFGHPRPDIFRESDERMVVGLAAHAAVAVDNARLYEELREARDHLEAKVEERTSQLTQMAGDLTQEVKERTAAEARIREMLARLVEIQEDERYRIARNIHDELGQHLTALRINLRALAAKCESVPDVREQSIFVEQLAESLDSTVDTVTWELRPAALETLGLVNALEDLVKSWSARFRIPAEVTVVGGGTVAVPETAWIHVYRITQEALHNIYKHSQAARAGVIIDAGEDSFSLIIEDNGKGMDVDRPTNGNMGADQRCLGLISMRERAALIRGSLEIESTLGTGTTIFLKLPVLPQNSDR